MSQLLNHLKKNLKRPVYSGHDIKNIERISTGLANLDLILGGGLPKGRVIQIWGKESVGKSALCLSLIRNRQLLNEEAEHLYIDAERTITEDDITMHNLDKDRFVLYKPVGGEDAIDVAVSALNGGAEFVVIDSVPYLRPKRVQEEIMKNSEYRDVSGIANLLERVQSKIITALDDTNGNIIFINQERPAKDMYSQPSYPGGSALKFMLSISLHIKSAKKDKDKPYCITQTLHTSKNKTHTPLQSTSILLTNRVASTGHSLLEAALTLNILKQGGGGTIQIAEPYKDKLEGAKYPKGKDNTAKFLMDNQDEYDLLFNLVVKAAEENQDITAPEEDESLLLIEPLDDFEE